MRIESKYFNESFKTKHSSVMKIAYILILAFPITVFGIIKYGMSENVSVHVHREGRGPIITGFIKGLFYGSIIELVFLFALGIVMVITLKKVMTNFQKKTKIIVAIDFVNSNNISLQTKNSKDVIVNSTISVENLKVTEVTNQMDGIGHGEFDCIEFRSVENELFGKIYKNHFTWTEEQIKQIEANVKMLPTLSFATLAGSVNQKIR